MDYSLVLLFSLFQALSMGTAAPLPVEVVTMKSKVKWMAEQLLVRLDRLDTDIEVDVVLCTKTEFIVFERVDVLLTLMRLPPN